MFDYQRRIHLSDTDAAGVVYFAKGLEICHEAYEESLAAARINLKQMIREGKVALPIVRAEIDFLRPLGCGDLIQVNFNTRQINGSEFAIAYQIVLVDNDNLEQAVIKAQTRHVCINPRRRQRIDFPPAIQQWLEVH
ncbi:MAG: thioesterase family protein [Cyanobacteria bacterium J06623_7]